jgi:hypothetical protein
MVCCPHVGTAPVVEDYPWAGHKRIIDIGGAYGSFIASLLERHSGLQGILFDQEQVSFYLYILIRFKYLSKDMKSLEPIQID